MPQLSERSETNRFIGLFVGESGSGKTAAAASFPKPIHFDDFDGRIGGAQGLQWLPNLTGIDYDYYPPKQPGLIPKLNSRLESMLNASIVQTRELIQLPTTHVTDSLTNMTYAFVCQALSLTHKPGEKGKFIGDAKNGVIAMPGPEDYGLEAQATYDYIAFLKSLPIPNVIMSAHIIDRYGKADPSNPFADSVVIGEKLSIRDKISENIKSHFDHVFKFERITTGNLEKFYITFRGGIARSSYSWLPSGRQDITNQHFFSYMMKFLPKSPSEDTALTTQTKLKENG